MKLKPVVAGLFYPGKARDLEKVLGEFSNLKPKDLPGEALGMLLPHAGYPYSGAVAARGYLSLPVPPRTVVVAGPSHYLPFQGCSVFAGESVGTPLGELAVDQETAEFLTGFHGDLRWHAPAFAREHSVEVHFPLIQKFWPGARVVPVVMGQGERAVGPLAAALVEWVKRAPFLFVASSDLSHYPDYATAQSCDQRFLRVVLEGDEEKVGRVDGAILAEGHRELHCTHCGHEPLAVLLRLAKELGAGKGTLLEYRNSGDVTGDKKKVVGYASVAFCK